LKSPAGLDQQLQLYSSYRECDYFSLCMFYAEILTHFMRARSSDCVWLLYTVRTARKFRDYRSALVNWRLMSNKPTSHSLKPMRNWRRSTLSSPM